MKDRRTKFGLTIDDNIEIDGFQSKFTETQNPMNYINDNKDQKKINCKFVYYAEGAKFDEFKGI